jgi:hypothetical protein
VWSTGRSLGRAAGYFELELELLLTPQQMATGVEMGDYRGSVRGVPCFTGLLPSKPLEELKAEASLTVATTRLLVINIYHNG